VAIDHGATVRVPWRADSRKSPYVSIYENSDYISANRLLFRLAVLRSDLSYIVTPDSPRRRRASELGSPVLSSVAEAVQKSVT